MKHLSAYSSIIRTFCAALALSAASAYATPVNLVQNGGFESTTNGTGQIGLNTNVNHWSSANVGYNFVYGAGEADTTGAMSWFNSPMTLWGSNNGGHNTLTSDGNFIAADGDYGLQAISQLITGLVVGQRYAVNFEWAAAQQYGFFGETTEHWVVSLGDERQATSIYANCSQCFSGWMQASMTFTATSTSQLLSFLAGGTPEGVPPFSLLDNVSMYAVPEPGTWLLMAGGLALCLMSVRRKSGITG